MKKPSLAFLALLTPLLLGADEPGIERGRRIYVETASPSGGEIVAVLGSGESEVEVEGSAVPCSGCHGRDGRGRPEGGVTPTDITWAFLSKPYGNVTATGRKIPTYDEKGLERAITDAVDPAGYSFHVAMPRYRMSRQDMDDLIAYLKTLGNTADPGVTATALRVGVVLPPEAGPLAPLGRAVRSALSARLDQVNRDGGIYDRRIEPLFLAATGSPAERRAQVAAFLEREEIFASVAAFFAGADLELAGAFEDQRVPVIGPMTLHPREDDQVNRYVFYLQPGIEAQAKALARFIRESGRNGASEPARPAILAPAGESLDAVIQGITTACEGWASPTVLRYERDTFAAGELARQLAEQKAEPLFFLGSASEALSLLRAAVPLSWRPRLLVTAASTGEALLAAPPDFADRIFVALPDAPGRPVPAAEDAHTPEHLSAQRAALGAVEILLEGLRRAGRDVDRERLVETLEGIRYFTPGFGPPISFGPSRRLGARGAYIVALDPKVPVPGWIDLP